jgi:hypothetical protein
VTVPEGSLQVFSVDTEEQARKLLVAACQTNLRGEFIASELAAEQTIENLDAFSARLADTAEKIKLFGESDEDSDEDKAGSSSDDPPRRLRSGRCRAKKGKSRRANSKRSSRR